MMKKTIYVATAAGALAFGGIVFANTDSTENNAAAATETPNTATSQQDIITFEEASEKALKAANGTITDIELDNGRNPNYEVDIIHDGFEYDLKLDAFTGEVLEQDSEKEDGDEEEAAALSGDLISSDEAVEAALAAAGGTVKEVSLDNDDGVASYEIELQDGKTTHEITVNAVDGSILENESDTNDDGDDD
jgi:uncharacterized membrane protein YkoI